MKRPRDEAKDSAEERRILDLVGSPDYRPAAQRELVHRLQVPSGERPAARDAIQRLLADGRLVRLSRGRIAAPGPGGTVAGRLHRHPEGYGFVTPDEGGPALFVPRSEVGQGLTGDRVVVRTRPSRRGGRPEGKIVETLVRADREALGVFEARGRAGVVRGFWPSAGLVVGIPGSFRSDARDGQVVRVEILGGREPSRLEGKVLEVLGDLDDSRTDLPVLAAKHDLDLRFPRKVLAEAERLPGRIDGEERERRTVFDDPAPVTIDGESARDFDDALAVSELPGGGFRLFVHIADVSAYVRPGSPLDEEAFRRGTSVYFPERVLPMFPERISNDLCSLRPRVERLVQTAILDVDADGRPRDARFADGIIRSAARLTYGQAARVLEGGRRVPGVPSRVVPMLLTAERLRRVLEKRRMQRGSLDFDMPEPQILLDVDGAVTGIRTGERNPAHRLVEECMIAANEAVAAHLRRRRAPCMFRVHDPPDPDKVEQLEELVRSLGARVPARKAEGNPRHLRRLMESVEGRDEHSTVVQLVLRSLSRARYTCEHQPHFGLGSRAYCHFTSPIRRYPDLVVHRLLRAACSGDAIDEGVVSEEDARHCSERERRAEDAEREMLRRKKIAFLADSVGRCFEGVVTGVATFGVFVQLRESLLDGLIRTEHLDQRYALAPNGYELRAVRGKGRIRVGQEVTVRLARVDRVLQRVDLTPEPRARR